MNNQEFANKLIDLAKNYKTLYVMGCFGAPMTEKNKARYTQNHSYNKQPSRTKMIMNATADTYAFDCVCMCKGILWGWNGNPKHIYGGASYASNGVPDIGADTIIKRCTDVSSDFTKIEVGELVHMSGHVGVYVGNGLAVECTPKWKNGVQLTACNCDVAGYNRRNWTTHGKLPYVEYLPTQPTKPAVKPTEPVKTAIAVGDLVKIVGNTYYTGKTIPTWVKNQNWYVMQINGDRVVINQNEKKTNAICSPINIKDIEIVKTGTTVTTNKKSNEELAKECIRGLWGNGSERKRRLQAAGYNYRTIQNIVNEMLK